MLPINFTIILVVSIYTVLGLLVGLINENGAKVIPK